VGCGKPTGVGGKAKNPLLRKRDKSFVEESDLVMGNTGKRNRHRHEKCGSSLKKVKERMRSSTMSEKKARSRVIHQKREWGRPLPKKAKKKKKKKK